MASLRLGILDDRDEIFIQFFVDDRDLGLILRESAGPAAPSWMEDVLTWSFAEHDLERTVLGKSARTDGLEHAILFVCGCGQWACGHISTRVTTTPTTITFSNFVSYPPIDISHGPIEFARANYEAAVADLERQIGLWAPRPRDAPRAKPPLITPPPS